MDNQNDRTLTLTVVQPRDLKQEEYDKIRCANYLLDMIIKYGPKIRAEEKFKNENKE